MKFTTGEEMDSWQKKVMLHEGNMALRCGRQTGKSETISEKSKELALKHKDTTTMVIAASQRQSSLIFEKIIAKIEIQHNKMIEKELKFWQKENADKIMNVETRRKIEWKKGLFKEAPTQTKAILLNGSRIYCLPTGKTGAFIRGFTVDFLIADEAAFIPEAVWTAIMPMIAVSKKLRDFGWIFLLSTPFGKGGFYYNSCLSDDYKQIHITSEKCERIPKDFLRKERVRMTKQEYAQEYLAEFIDEFSQLFPTTLIKKCMTFISWDFEKDYNKSHSYYLGVDFARFGGDENAHAFAELPNIENSKIKLRIVKCTTTERKSIPDTVRRIEKYNDNFKFRKLFLDDGGVGGGATDMLEESLGKRKIRGLNNSSKSTTGKIGKILKEDLYSNALAMMEKGEIELISNLDLLKSLKSVTFEYTKDRNLRIYGNYTHLAEAFVRACWSIKEKGLKIFIA